MSQPLVVIKRISKKAKVPKYASEGAAGLDLFSIEERVITSGEAELISVGFCMELKKGYEAQIRPRSGLALKHGITVLNSPGTIDSDYRGEVKVLLINFGSEDFKVMRGDRIAQMVIAKATQAIILEELETLTPTNRGSGGFGSTGKR